MDQRRIGLTGGIATGKTTVSQYLTQYCQLPVVDADLLAREAVQSGSTVLASIHQRYGDRILQSDGGLNRSELGQIIFADSQERLWVESQIHPVVRDRILEQLAEPQRSRSPIVVLDIPLLFESNMTDLVTEIWVVACSPEQQLERLIHRNGLSPEAAQSRMDSQWSLMRKVEAADVILKNHSTRKALYDQIDAALMPQCLANETINPDSPR